MRDERGTAPAAPARKVSGRAGINLTVLGLEIRRLLRNRRTVIFALIFPVVLFLFIGTNSPMRTRGDGHGNVSAFLVVSMALYGGDARDHGGRRDGVDRAGAGWSRQLRLTPLSPMNYIMIKASPRWCWALPRCWPSSSSPTSPACRRCTPGYSYLWFELAALVWIGSLVFAALGLFIGYLLPSENVMQFLGLVMAVLSFAGGLFFPLNQAAQILQDIAKWTPMYGLNQLVHAPLIGGSFDFTWVINAVVWFGLFVAGAVWRFRKDTARV